MKPTSPDRGALANLRETWTQHLWPAAFFAAKKTRKTRKKDVIKQTTTTTTTTAATMEINGWNPRMEAGNGRYVSFWIKPFCMFHVDFPGCGTFGAGWQESTGEKQNFAETNEFRSLKYHPVAWSSEARTKICDPESHLKSVWNKLETKMTRVLVFWVFFCAQGSFQLFQTWWSNCRGLTGS